MAEKRLVEFPLEGGGSIIVEVIEEVPGPRPAGRLEKIQKVQQTFEKALDKVRPIASALIDTFRNIGDPPDEIQVEFGLKMHTEAGAIIAATGVEANYKVMLTWRRERPDRAPSEGNR